VKKTKTADLLPLAVLLLAAAGCVLRSELYLKAMDGKGLLLQNHPLELLLWCCTGAAALVALPAARQGYRVKSYAANFDASLPAALGHILAGSGILLTVLLSPAPSRELIGTLWKVTGLVSCPALYGAAFSRIRGSRPFFGLYGMLSVFFAMHLVANYQLWCADPQLQNYVYAFLASLMLMLFAYYQAAFCVDGGSSFRLRLTGLLAVYFCLTALAKSTMPYLYGGCAVWAFTGLSRLRPRREKKAGDGHGAS